MLAVRLSLLSLLAIAVSACAVAPPRALPQASAVPETVRVPMPIDPRDTGLNGSQIALIAAVADEYKTRGHGPLVISYPDDASSTEALVDAVAEARTRLYAHGLDWRMIAGGTYDAAGQAGAPVVFSFTRYRAVSPECGDDWIDLRNARPGRSWPQFGCATATNLAAMIADPRDLARPTDLDAPDAARRQTVLDGYRGGESTASERTSAESGAVSDAVSN